MECVFPVHVFALFILNACPCLLLLIHYAEGDPHVVEAAADGVVCIEESITIHTARAHIVLREIPYIRARASG